MDGVACEEVTDEGSSKRQHYWQQLSPRSRAAVGSLSPSDVLETDELKKLFSAWLLNSQVQ